MKSIEVEEDAGVASGGEVSDNDAEGEELSGKRSTRGRRGSQSAKRLSARAKYTDCSIPLCDSYNSKCALSNTPIIYFLALVQIPSQSAKSKRSGSRGGRGGRSQ